MLLVLDVGNTNTVLGVFGRAVKETASEPDGHYPRLVAHWRVATNRRQTVDEYGVLFRNLFSVGQIEVGGIRGIVVASVVPPLDSTLRQMCELYFRTKPLFVEPGIRTGVPVRIDNPAEVGADRIANAVAALDKYGMPCVVVDFGTATNFDVVSAQGEYLGGVIAPGIGISAEALFQRTARLPRVDIRKPAHVIGSNTVACIQSGLYYGYLGMVDGILERLLEELDKEARVVATGGLAPLIAKNSKYISVVDDLITLEGLRLIWERNVKAASDDAGATGARRGDRSAKARGLR
jgi:type III pantothenate kinase